MPDLWPFRVTCLKRAMPDKRDVGPSETLTLGQELRKNETIQLPTSLGPDARRTRQEHDVYLRSNGTQLAPVWDMPGKLDKLPHHSNVSKT